VKNEKDKLFPTKIIGEFVLFCLYLKLYLSKLFYHPHYVLAKSKKMLKLGYICVVLASEELYL